MDIKVYWSDEDKVFIAEHVSGLKAHGRSKKEAIKELKVLLLDEELSRMVEEFLKSPRFKKRRIKN